MKRTWSNAFTGILEFQVIPTVQHLPASLDLKFKESKLLPIYIALLLEPESLGI